jgi:NAD/NADP transhydrogenase alpha subunit
MRIGIPREIKNREYRVAVTPAGVHRLVTSGHEVLVEADLKDFDRWLASVKAEAWDEGYSAGRLDGFFNKPYSEEESPHREAPNA